MSRDRSSATETLRVTLASDVDQKGDMGLEYGKNSFASMTKEQCVQNDDD